MRKRLKSATLLVVRIGPKGKLQDSLPCLHCTNAIRKFGIKKVAYSNGSGQIVEKSTKELVSARPSSGYRTFERDMLMM